MSNTARLTKLITTASAAALTASLALVGAAPANAATSVTETFQLTGCYGQQCAPGFLKGAVVQLRNANDAVIASGTVPASGVWKATVKPGTSYRIWVNKVNGTTCMTGIGHYHAEAAFVGAARVIPLAATFSWDCQPPQYF